ncbi:thyroid transcription factor 1-associated protein 26 [Zerene cesonia]|uniref:thyroid transcription factor 1-associated protein 26 n=1 Tax=Zerene cesonia TaxID=33412 RepID=UPI0018E55EE6|nr:thyroid transcription factor 1-associated protein 26 [Zerene cesonia]
MEKKRDSFFLPNKNQKNKHQGSGQNKNEKKNIDRKEGESSKTTKRQNSFDNNRPNLNEPSENGNGKKPFDKKTYRLKKYSKKYKLEQWEEQRKKRLLHEYQKSMKNDELAGTYKPKTFDEDVPDSGEVGRFVRHPDLIEKDLQNDQKSKKVPFAKAKEQFNKVKEEKLQKQQEKEKAREERNQKLQEYKKKKQERFKKLSKKTKKGQPVMSGRMELLLEKIKGK